MTGRPDIDRLADTVRSSVWGYGSPPFDRESSLAALDELVALARALRDCETQERQLRAAVRECCDGLKAAEARVAELEAALRGFVEFCETLAAEEGNPVFALYATAKRLVPGAALAGDGGGA